MTAEHAGSRLEDSPLYKRLSTLEDHVSTLERQVDRLTNDQKHQSEMSNVQLTLMQKAQELTISKIEALAASITLMSAEADKSPAGRSLIGSIALVSADVEDNTRRIDTLAEWQTGFRAVIVFIGSVSGLVSVSILILKAVGVIGP